MTLFEIDNAILDCVDMETGEILDEQRLNELEMDKKTKLTNLCKWVKNLKADVAAYKEQKDYFDKQKKAAENKLESLIKYIETYLNGETFEAEDKSAKVSYRKSESLEIADNVDIFSLPENLIEYQDPKPLKDEIKKWIKAGNTFEGITIVEKRNMSIK